MSEFENITKEFIKTHEFPAEVPSVDYENNEKSFRPSSESVLPVNPEKLQMKLRQKFADINATAFNNFAQMEVRCDIKENTMRSYINGRRNIPIYAVAKFCIGAKLSIETTKELFKLCGHIIDANYYRFDAIVIDAVKCEDDIDIFYESCKEFGLQHILKKMSRS